MALANKDLPLPGSPSNNTPLGGVTLNFLNFSLSLKPAISSISSILTSSNPATSFKVVLDFSPPSKFSVCFFILELNLDVSKVKSPISISSFSSSSSVSLGFLISSNKSSIFFILPSISFLSFSIFLSSSFIACST